MRRADIAWNDLLAFVLEIAALALWGLWARRLGGAGLPGWIAAFATWAAFILVWMFFFAPTAACRLPMPWLAIGKWLLLLPPGLLYWWGNAVFSLLWAGLVLLHLGWGWFKGGL